MNTTRRYLTRCRHRLGGLGVTILMLPILGWVWTAARGPVLSVLNGAIPGYLFSGKLFSEPFDTAHAGFVLDQPTIGKWLFWFTVMAVTSLPYAGVVRGLSNRAKTSGYVAYGTCVAVLGVGLLCILSWPLFWLIQYMSCMGCTPRRLCGLLYAVAGGSLVLRFIALALTKLNGRTDRASRHPSDGWYAALVLSRLPAESRESGHLRTHPQRRSPALPDQQGSGNTRPRCRWLSSLTRSGQVRTHSGPARSGRTGVEPRRRAKLCKCSAVGY